MVSVVELALGAVTLRILTVMARGCSSTLPSMRPLPGLAPAIGASLPAAPAHRVHCGGSNDAIAGSRRPAPYLSRFVRPRSTRCWKRKPTGSRHSDARAVRVPH